MLPRAREHRGEERARSGPSAEANQADAAEGATLEGFVEELGRRAALQHEPTVDGVTLASLHAAKGLEWDAVFLVGLLEGVLPTTYARTPAAVEEERRLFYVGITRARQWLTLSYASARVEGGRARRPSRFLPMVQSGPEGRARNRRETRDPDGTRRRLIVTPCRVCGASLTAPVDRKLGRCATCPSTMDEELYERLRQWRLKVAAAQSVPAYVVFTDLTLTAIAERRPSAEAELTQITGIGQHKLAKYGEAVLALVAGASPDDLVPSVTEPSPASS
jgi:DNA helicase II / ATP-dependent DNA helicase PcrA